MIRIPQITIQSWKCMMNSVPSSKIIPCDVNGTFAPKYKDTLPKGYITKFSFPSHGIRLSKDIEPFNPRPIFQRHYKDPFLPVVGVLEKYRIHEIKDDPDSIFMDIVARISFDNRSTLEDRFGLGGVIPRGRMVPDGQVKLKPLLAELDFEVYEPDAYHRGEYIAKFVFFTEGEDGLAWKSHFNHFSDYEVKPEFWKARKVEIEVSDILFGEVNKEALKEVMITPEDYINFRAKAVVERVFPDIAQVAAHSGQIPLSHKVVSKSDIPYWLEVGKKGKNRLDLQCEMLDPKTLELMEGLHLTNKSRILDVGCGTGSMACQIAAKYKCQVLGIDVEIKQLELAKAAAQKNGVTELTRFEQCLATNLHTDVQEQFDVVMCRLFLCHLNNVEEVLDQMIEKVKPGGVLICEEMSHGFKSEYCSCSPGNEAYDFWLRLGQKYVEIQATDFEIGCKLPTMLRKRGLDIVINNQFQPKLSSAHLKAIFRLGVEELQDKFVNEGHLNRDEFTQIIDKFSKLENDNFVADYFPMAQLVARKLSAKL